MANILLVDDDKDILDMLAYVLEHAGHRPFTALSGSKGLEIIKTSPLHLLIVDIMMPEMTGYEFTRRVRKLPGQGEVPILIYSARSQAIDKQTALEAGATDYLPKNSSPAEIIEKINTLLSKKSEAPSAPPGKAIACFSLRGGAGVTTLAVNMAVILAVSHRTPVSLVDLNPMAGHASLMLGLQPKNHLPHILATADDTLSEPDIKPYLTSHKTGVHLLASPLIPPKQISNYHLQKITGILQTKFRFNLIDFPHILDPIQLELLASLNTLILVLSPDVPSLQSAVAALKYLKQQDFDTKKIVPVLNHNTPNSNLTLEAVQKIIQRPLGAEIPFEPEMITAASTGHPLALHKPKSAAATTFARLAMQVG